MKKQSGASDKKQGPGKTKGKEVLPRQKKDSLPVIGIGASAGGLEAPDKSPGQNVGDKAAQSSVQTGRGREMKKTTDKTADFKPLRRRAEEHLKEKQTAGPTLDQQDLKKLVHELQVHQIELEMQNEELHRAREEVEEVLARYTDLYDFAPVGYLTFDETGLISELNLTASRLLGVERMFLFNKPFSSSIQQGFQDRFYLHLQEVLESSAKQTCELVLKKKDGATFDAQLESVPVKADGHKVVRTALTDITKHKRAEEAIQHFSSFPQMNPNPVLETNMSGEFIFSNPASLRILKELALKKEDANLFLPDDFDVILRNWDKKTSVTLFREVIIKDRIFGETVQLVPAFQVVRIYAHEITTRKHAEKALQAAKDDLESRVKDRTTQLQDANRALEEEIITRKQAEEAAKSERLQLFNVLETIPAYVILLTPDYHAPFANRIFRKSFGDANGKRCFEFLFDRKEPCDNCETYSVLKTGKPHQWQWRGPNDCDYDVYDFPFTDTDGSTLILEMGIDVTKRIKAEDALRGAVNYGRSLIEASLDPFITIGPGGTITDVNTATEMATGYSRNELIGTDFANYFIAPDKARAGYEQAFREGFVRDYPLEIRHRDGKTTPVLYNASVYKDDSGQTVGVFAATRDITLQKRAEEALQKAYDDLKTETEERKKTEEQLRQAHKMEAVGTLAGGIAHDFNNILAAIMGFTEMVIEDLPEGGQEEKNLRYVMKSAHRGKDLIRQILAFSRKSDYVRGSMSVTPLIKETIQLLRASIPSTIEITFKTTATSDTVLASPTEIQQMLMNLVTNAALAMEDKGGTLEISLNDIDFQLDSPAFDLDITPGEYIQLVVKDTGNGMTPEVMKRIFEPFFTTREVGKGTGMGLAVVYGIITDLHGTITVESEPGAGSLFRVFLPKTISEITFEQVKADDSPRGDERILFLDDEELLAEWGYAALTRLGYKVTSMTDSTKALKTFSADPAQFDLVITDQTMPGLTGMHLARKLLKTRPDLPIILCTGHSETVTQEEVQAIGIRELFIKPVNKTEFARTIRRLLDTKSQ